MKEQITWRSLLLMAGYEAPKEWSGQKCKKVMNALGTDEFEKYLPEMKTTEWALK